MVVLTLISVLTNIATAVLLLFTLGKLKRALETEHKIREVVGFNLPQAEESRAGWTDPEPTVIPQKKKVSNADENAMLKDYYRAKAARGETTRREQ
jgi:hypothetical protein